MLQYHLARMLLGILEFYDEQQEENMVKAKYSLLTYFIFGLEYHYQFLKGQNRNHGSFSWNMKKLSHPMKKRFRFNWQQESVVIRCKSFVNDTMEAVKGKICCSLFSPLDKFIVSSRYQFIQIYTNT